MDKYYRRMKYFETEFYGILTKKRKKHNINNFGIFLVLEVNIFIENFT